MNRLKQGRPPKPGGPKSSAQRSREFRARQAFKRRLKSIMPIPADPLSLAIVQLVRMAKAGAMDADELRPLANTIAELHQARRNEVEASLIHCDLEVQRANRTIRRLQQENDDLRAKLMRSTQHVKRMELEMRALERRVHSRERKVTESAL